MLSLGVDCDHDEVKEFANQTDQDVWYATQTDLGQPPPDELQWLSIPAGESVIVGGYGCARSGTVLIATEPDIDTVIDRRVLSDEDQWCANGTWEWSGPGDHE